MTDGMEYLDFTKDGLKEIQGLGSDLSKAIAKGEEQASTRDGTIETINEMCDALQLGTDLICKELSAGIVEFNRVQHEQEAVLRGYFERLALRLSEPALRLLLHEGAVCGALHKLGDRFEQPFSKQTIAGVSLWENVKAFFTRSTRMSGVLHGLVEGERDYLRDFATFLDDTRDKAEAATALSWGDHDALRAQGETLVALMRDKRTALQDTLRELRTAADAAIAALH